MATTREFNRDELDELDIGPWNCVASWVLDEHRWAVEKALVFEHEGAHWQVSYFDPATEMQEGQDVWDYGQSETDPVLATQVEKRQVTVERWEPV